MSANYICKRFGVKCQRGTNLTNLSSGFFFWSQLYSDILKTLSGHKTTISHLASMINFETVDTPVN